MLSKLWNGIQTSSRCESSLKYSARAAHCGARMMSKLGSRNSRRSFAETTSATKKPTTSPQTMFCAPTRKSQPATEKSTYVSRQKALNF